MYSIFNFILSIRILSFVPYNRLLSNVIVLFFKIFSCSDYLTTMIIQNHILSNLQYQDLLDNQMQNIEAFFQSCQKGRGWQECKKYCLEGAPFQCDVLPTIKTLEEYTNWMKGIVQGAMPDANYQVISATHSENVYVFCAKFFATHTLPGGPVPPSDPPKKCVCDYAYIIWFNNQHKVTKMRKIWDQLTAFKQLGWPIA